MTPGTFEALLIDAECTLTPLTFETITRLDGLFQVFIAPQVGIDLHDHYRDRLMALRQHIDWGN